MSRRERGGAARCSVVPAADGSMAAGLAGALRVLSILFLFFFLRGGGAPGAPHRFAADLALLEQRQRTRTFKFGVLYARADQTREEEMFCTFGASWPAASAPR